MHQFLIQSTLLDLDYMFFL